MEISHAPEDALSLVSTWRAQGLRVALVPTMGNLHAGHLALVSQAQALADRVVVSLFVNPLQFGENEDLAVYPRTLAEDQRQLIEAGVDLMFVPEEHHMYPQGRALMTRVTIPALSTILCGHRRPGHFAGVATVVNKLLHIIPAHTAIFGEKDYQQLAIIKQMVSDLNIAIDIVAAPIVRELDGLAMSSRNQYLTASQRDLAPRLYEALTTATQQVLNGQAVYADICDKAEQNLTFLGFVPDYFVICRDQDLQVAQPQIDRKIHILVAAQLGETRLIDNVAVTLPSFS